MECKNIEELRKMLTEKLIKYKESGEKDHIKLDIDKELFQQILFKNKKIAIPDNLWKLLDLSGVSLDGVDVKEINFTGSKGVVIDPQKVCNKDLSNTRLSGVEIRGSFDGVDVMGVDFTGSKGVVIDPQTVKYASLNGTKLAGVEITGSLDGVDVRGTDFTESKGVIKLNPQIVYDKDLRSTKLAGVEITGLLDGVCVEGTDFTGCKGTVIIDPQTVYDKSLWYTKLAGVEIDGSFNCVNVWGADFTGSEGAKMSFYEYQHAIKSGANLTDVQIYNDEYKKIEDKIEKAFQPQLKLE